MRLATTFAAVLAPTLASLLLTASTTCHPPHAAAPTGAPAAPCPAPSSTSAAAPLGVPAPPPAPVREELVSGCTPDEHRARLRELAELDKLVTLDRGHRIPKVIDARRALAELRAMLARPCLQHLARVMAVPNEASVDELQSSWRAMLEDLAQSMTIQRRDGAPHILLPRQLLPSADEALRAQVTPLLCADPESPSSACRRTMTYRLRTMFHFDELRRAHQPARHDEAPETLPAFTCSPNENPIRVESFEAWMDCVAAHAPYEHDYASGLTFRSIERGWLMVRGDKHPYTDQIRLFDLETGAVYISAGSNGYSDCGGSFPAGTMTATGTIGRDQLRELAYFLLTSPAFVTHRDEPVLAELPSDVPHQLAFRAPDLALSPLSWTFFRHDPEALRPTEWAFSDGTYRARGSFRTLTGSTYAKYLLLLLERGLVDGCAPARLPPLDGLLSHSRDEAPPDEDARLAASIERQLARLATRACPGAK